MPNSLGSSSHAGQENRKRKQASPIEPGQDYGFILRRQEVSASPALKKLRNTSGKSSSDEEVSFLKHKKMNSDGEMETEEKSPAEGGEKLTVGFFEKYMATHITSQLSSVGRNITKVDEKVDQLREKVGSNGSKLKNL